MNKLNILSKLAIAGVVGAIGTVSVQTNAQAAFLADYTGYSVFASPDPFNDPPTNVEPNPLGDGNPISGSDQCDFCDSTVSFTVWENESGSLTQDLFINFGIETIDIFGRNIDRINPETLPVPNNLVSGIIDDSAKYLYLYQVVNTDPLGVFGGQEAPIDEFLLSVETINPKDSYFGPSPYTSGGYFDQYSFQNFSRDIFDNPLTVPTDPLGGQRLAQECLNDLTPPPGTGLGSNGCPGNWTPDVLVDVTPIVLDPDGAAPLSLAYTPGRDDEVERQQAALGNPTTSPTTVLLWDFNNGIGVDPDCTPFDVDVNGDPIAPANPTPRADCDGKSYILFATSNHAPEFPWARTQSQVGEGSSGDVVGVKVTTPEPSTIVGLLAVGGLGLGLKRKKQS